jgi:hypothetical protein
MAQNLALAWNLVALMMMMKTTTTMQHLLKDQVE